MISIYSQNGEVEYKVTDFILDSTEDLSKLQEKYSKTCGPGSSALILETSDVYMLSGQREWVKL